MENPHPENPDVDDVAYLSHFKSLKNQMSSYSACFFFYYEQILFHGNICRFSFQWLTISIGCGIIYVGILCVSDNTNFLE